jgi:hypothetical protein
MERKEKAPQTPAQRMEEALRAWLTQFSKTPYVYPVSIAIAAGVYYLTLVYAANVCLINLLTPLVLLGVLWTLKVKSIKKLAIIGLVAFVILSGVWLLAYTQFYAESPTGLATSEDGRTLTNGTVTPSRGSGSQVYNFTLTVHLRTNQSGAPVYFKNVTVAIQSVSFPGVTYENNTMTLLENDTADLTQRYFYDTQISTAINAYAFWAEYPNGSVEIGGKWSGGLVTLVQGPFPTSTGAIVAALVPFCFVQTLLNVLVAYYLIIGMIWWTRRARRMREQQIERWQKEEAEKEAAQPKSTRAKVPSLAQAMGTDKTEGETFVCSECGADVPADATVCPKCGERFD